MCPIALARDAPFSNSWGHSKTVLVDDWNVILEPKLNKARRGTRGLDKSESNLINLLSKHDLVDRFRQITQGGRCRCS